MEKDIKWLISKLESKHKLLVTKLERETDADKIDLLFYDILSLEEYIFDYYNPKNNNLTIFEGYKKFKETLEKCSYIWNDIENFRSITHEPIAKKIPDIKKHVISQDDLFQITHDFFKSLDKPFFDYFMKTFKQRKDHVIFEKLNNSDEYSGETIPIPSLKESFIRIKYNYTLDDAITSIHEYMHATSALINPKHFYITKDLFTEIDTLFIELLVSDYLESIFKDGDGILSKVSKHDSFCYIAENLNNSLKIMNAEKRINCGFLDKNDLINVARAEFRVFPYDLIDLFTKDDITDHIYLTGYIFAIELYKMYQKDKEKALKYLRQIILLNKNFPKEYYNSILELGLIPNLHLQEYHQECKNDLLKLTRKKSE